MTKIEHEGWKAELNGKVLTIEKDGEEREYDIKEENDGIEFEGTDEYFFIRTKKFDYQFKFEVDNFFVGDKIDKNGEFMDEFASHVFGE